ncbi:vesicular glutamate transporter 3-like isoform X1 [Scylla paramamosain]|uniref:vesicular glutamate transporter 3-like isoform X1 n=1 Tax=Scylla paramamosain TaxID=85552 RepID=UPI003083431F
MGLLQGPIFPAIYSIISRWTLPGETTTMISASMSGASLGALVALGLSGIVIKSFGWRWVFWGSGIVTLAWLPFWVLYVRDSPCNHPGISKTELHRLSKNHNQLRKKVPWSRIFKSKYVYLFMMMEFVNVWTQTIMISEGPTFLTNQVGIRLDDASKLNTILTVLAQFLIIFYGWLSDFLERREWLSMLTVRRLFQMFGTLVMVGCLMGLAFAGCDAFEVAVYFIVLVIGLPITIVTYIIGPMIIAPNYAGTLTGMMGLGTIGGFLLPLFVSLFMDKKNGWMTVFLVSAAINLVTGVIYVIWMPNEEEEWNMYEEIPESDKDGMKKNGKMKGGTLTQ